MNKIRILIADDHKLIRETWTYILDSDPRFQVIAQCGDAEEAVNLARLKHPDMVLMDINMTPIPDWKQRKRLGKYLRLHGLSAFLCIPNLYMQRKMLQMGARGYVTENSSKEEMIEAILEVAGEINISAMKLKISSPTNCWTKRKTPPILIP